MEHTRPFIGQPSYLIYNLDLHSLPLASHSPTVSPTRYPLYLPSTTPPLFLQVHLVSHPPDDTSLSEYNGSKCPFLLLSGVTNWGWDGALTSAGEAHSLQLKLPQIPWKRHAGFAYRQIGLSLHFPTSSGHLLQGLALVET